MLAWSQGRWPGAAGGGAGSGRGGQGCVGLPAEGRDQLLRQVREITAGLDPAAVMIALGALLRRGIDRALDEGREDEADFEESERFFERWLGWEERRADRS